MARTRNITTLTERGQTAVPASIRKALKLRVGQSLLWEEVSPMEVRVRIVQEKQVGGARAMLGFAKRFDDKPKTTAAWMRELREGERK
jgi:bifunctional DNA-binding transcriptional regulator/antitoxin component of YhaV-PrlF toxin-antitoxin module